MAQQAQSVKLHITYGHTTYGHTDDAVVMVFSTPAQQVGMKPAEVDAMVKSLEDMKVALAAHRATKGMKP